MIRVFKAIKCWGKGQLPQLELGAYISWTEIKLRYAQTFLGPLWITITTGAWIGGMGLISTSLFGGSFLEVVPYIGIGITVWMFLASTLVESGDLFFSNKSMLLNTRLPYNFYVYKFIFKQVFQFMHNAVILVLILLLDSKLINGWTLMFVPGLILLLCNVYWVALLIGMLSVRFRDFKQFIAMSTNLLVFITPLFWQKAILKQHVWIAEVNPFAHALAIVRQPLMGHPPPLISYIVLVSMLFAGHLITWLLYRKYKSRIVFYI